MLRRCTLLIWGAILHAQSRLYLVYFQDKPDSLLLYPEQYLSHAALKRRVEQGIPISISDASIPQAWIQELGKYSKVWGTSRWLNAALVEVERIEQLPPLPFLRCVQPLSRAPIGGSVSTASILPTIEPKKASSTVNALQLNQLRLPFLHQQGYLGQGIRIAILDAGFPAMNQIPAFHHLFQEGRYITGYDFVQGDSSIFEDNSHGTLVASVIVAHDLNQLGYHGGAPQASIILARTENALSESRIEEWNWARAAEWADSLGAHIIQSSLGYSTFDDPAENYTYADMNGQTAITTQAARMAAQKGLLVVTSAGNEGNSPWRYITAPADADSVIAVGAIGISGQIAPFSSRGPTFDGRIKPDLVALGWGTSVVGLSGNVQQASGTSFAAPLITSLAACLWQVDPTLPGWVIREALIRSGDRYQNPDTAYGYGIPNAERAYLYLRQMQLSSVVSPSLYIYPNPASERLTVFLRDSSLGWYDLEIYDTSGRLILRRIYRGMTELVLPLEGWKSGAYLVTITPHRGQRTWQTVFLKI